MFREYYNALKPNMVYGNTLMAFAAFLFASRWQINSMVLAATLVGIAFVIAGACAVNNYLDRDIDKKMQRTQVRALPRGAISPHGLLVLGIVLALCGATLLYTAVNTTATLAALIGFCVYIFLYTPLKRRTPHATLVGAVAGAMPAVVGYTAVSGTLDARACILFLILCIWQVPHFDSIAIYRLEEYKAAGIPLLPLKIGIQKTKYHITTYITLFCVAVSLFSYAGYAGYTYLFVVLLAALVWLVLALKGFKASNDKKWARKLFFVSLIVLLTFCAMLALSPLLP